MKTLSFWKKSVYSALVFFGTLMVLSVGYSLVGNLSTADKVGSGSGLTATSWNKIIDGVLDLDTRLSNLSFVGGNVGVGTASPSVSLEVNGSIKGGRTSEAWSVERIGGVSSAVWTTIPGLDKTFTLTRPALVQLNSTGEQRAISGICHTAYRFEVDGIARGEPNHGQRIYVSNLTDAWWVTWALSDFADMSAGTHTVRIQARDSSGLTPCTVCMESGGSLPGYTWCNLNIAAFYN